MMCYYLNVHFQGQRVNMSMRGRIPIICGARCNQRTDLYLCLNDRRICALWCSTQIITRRYLISKCHSLARYNRKCSFIYVHEKSTFFLAPISKKQLFHSAEFQQSRKIDVESADTNSFTPLSTVSFSLRSFLRCGKFGTVL